MPLPSLIEPERVCAYVNEGRIARIGEIVLPILNGDRARFNDHGVHLPGGELIPRSALRAHRITLSQLGSRTEP